MSVTADSVVVDLVANVQKSQQDVNNYATAFERAMARIDAAAGQNDTAAEQRARRELARRLRLQEAIRQEADAVAFGAGRAGAATRNIGRNIADIGVGIAGQQSPFLILAQQAPQLADALADTGGKAAKVAAFFAGPWGAALLAAGSVAAIFGAKLLESGEASEALAKELEVSERKARAADAAQAAFSQTLLGAAKASRELSENLTKQNQNQLDVARSALAAAEAQRQFNIQTRQKIADQLREQLNNAKNLRDDIKRGNPLTSPEADEANQAALATYTLRITRLQGDYAIAQNAVADAINATVQARIPLLNAAAEARSSKQVELTQQHAAAVSALKSSYEKAALAANKLDPAGRQEALRSANQAYIDGVAAQDRQLADSLDAVKQAQTDAKKAQREAIKDAKEFQSILESTEKAFSPVAAAAREYAEQLERISRLQAGGAISSATADRYREAADVARIKAAGGGGGPSIEDILNRPGGISSQVTADDKRIADDFEREQALRKAQSDTEAYLQREREKNVRSLASIYRSAFEGGAKGIGEALKNALLDAIATALARQTIGAFSSLLGGGGGGGFLGSIAGSLFGRASGGYAAPRSLHRVNETAGGVELLRMGPTGGHVIPLGQAGATPRGGGVTVLQTISVDARGAVMNDQFARLILSQADQNARQITAVGSKAAYEASPERLQRQNLLGS